MSVVRVVGLGMAVFDVLARIERMPTWRIRGLVALEVDGGGPCATAIVAVERLGIHAGLIGTYGSNRAGQIKLQTLIDNGVDVSHMVRRPGAEMQAVIAFVESKTGERVFSGLRRFGDGGLRVDELDREYITAAEYLHLDGAHAQAALQAARWMHEAGGKVMLDGSSVRPGGAIGPEMRALAQEVDLLICGAGFGPALTGRTDLWEAGRAILDMGPRIVVQTEGKDGAYTVTREAEFHTPSFDVEVVDTTGCGDVFHGAFIVGQLKGWGVRETVEFASAVSALKAGKPGGRAGIPTFEQTISFLQERLTGWPQHTLGRGRETCLQYRSANPSSEPRPNAMASPCSTSLNSTASLASFRRSRRSVHRASWRCRAHGSRDHTLPFMPRRYVCWQRLRPCRYP